VGGLGARDLLSVSKVRPAARGAWPPGARIGFRGLHGLHRRARRPAPRVLHGRQGEARHSAAKTPRSHFPTCVPSSKQPM
jgi:hypothetical protein